MKALLSWLSDPYLHLIAIGTIVVAIGVAGSSRGDTSELCDLCRKHHDEARSCVRAAAAPPALERR